MSSGGLLKVVLYLVALLLLGSCTPVLEGVATGWRRPALAERRHRRDVHHYQAQFTRPRPRHRH